MMFSNIIPLYLKPAFAIAGGALLASLLFSLKSPLLYSIPITIFAIVVLFFLCQISGVVKFLISFAIVSFSALFFINKEKQIDIPDHCGAIVKVQLNDFSLTGEKIEEIGNPYYCSAIVRELRFSQKDTEPLILNLPVAIAGIPSKYRLAYGDILEIRGYLAKPQEALFEGDFDQKNFLLSRGFLYLLHPEEINVVGKKESQLSKLIDLRNSLMKRIILNIKSEENKKILAALLFGCRQGIDTKTRHKMLLAGTIHVIAISGLHVAIFAFLVFCFLFALPFRWRYFSLPFFVFIYVLSAGFQPSAVRAFLMITVWSWQKALLYPESGFTALLYALAVSLFLGPFGVLDPGFQYSFIITAFLIGSARKANHLQSLLFLKNNFIPDLLKLSFVQKIFFYGISSVIICITAFLSGLQVSLFNQNIINPLSIVLNLIVSPLLCIVFLVSFFVAIFPAGFFASVLEFVCNIFVSLLTSFLGTAFTLSTPHLLLFLTFFTLPLFFLVFVRQTKKIAFLCICSISIFLLALAYLPLLRTKDEIKVIHGQGLPPSIVIIENFPANVFIVDVPDRIHANKIIEFLSSRGIFHIDAVFCTNARIEHIKGAPFLLSRFNCGELIFLTNPAISPYAKFASQCAGENHIKVSIRTEPTTDIRISREIKSEKSNIREFQISSNTIIRTEQIRTGGTRIMLIQQNSSHTMSTKNSLRLYLSYFSDTATK